jgi:hypothetical protein
VPAEKSSHFQGAPCIMGYWDDLYSSSVSAAIQCNIPSSSQTDWQRKEPSGHLVHSSSVKSRLTSRFHFIPLHKSFERNSKRTSFFLSTAVIGWPVLQPEGDSHHCGHHVRVAFLHILTYTMHHSAADKIYTYVFYKRPSFIFSSL